MLHMTDVYVNWAYARARHCEVFHPFEWDIKEVDKIDRLPLVRVTEDLFDYIADDLLTIPNNLLETIHNEAHDPTNPNLEYAFIMCDGTRILVINTDGTKMPMEKSHVDYKEERRILRFFERDKDNMKVFDIEEGLPDTPLLKSDIKEVLGLTKAERTYKEALRLGLNRIEDRKNINEVKYWLVELDPSLHNSIKSNSFKTCFNMLERRALDGWSDNHRYVADCLSKNDKFCELLTDRAKKMMEPKEDIHEDSH